MAAAGNEDWTLVVPSISVSSPRSLTDDRIRARITGSACWWAPGASLRIHGNLHRLSLSQSLSSLIRQDAWGLHGLGRHR